MPDTHGGCDQSAPGVSDNDSLRYTQLLEGLRDYVGLSAQRPDFTAWPVTVTEAGAIEGYGSEFPRSQIDETARFEILNHTAVAMQQHHRIAGASFGVMKADAIHFDKLASGRILLLGVLRKVTIK